MKVFILTYGDTAGISSGYTEFIGMYSTKEKAEEAKANEMKKGLRIWDSDFYIEDIEIDKTYNKVYKEW